MYLTLHVILMLAMTLSLLAGVVIAHRKKNIWLLKHRGFGVGGFLLGMIGVLIMGIGKQLQGYPHLKSPHAKGGMTALIVLLLAPVLGTLLMRGAKKLRIPHRIAGIAGILLAMLAATFGTLSVLN